MDILSSNTPQDNPQKSEKRLSEKVSLNCTYCQKLYSVKKSCALRAKTNYCSRECLNADRKGEFRQCLFCGEEMYVQRCNLGRKKCCSYPCWWKYRKLSKIGAIRTKFNIICINCGNEFEMHKKGKRKFCSHKCSVIYRVSPNNPNYRGGKVDCICMFCGSPFQMLASRMKGRRGKFCSGTCRSRYTVKKQGGMVSSIEIAVKKVLDSLGENYHHQHRIGKFLVDFYLPDRNLVIEADGDYWHSLERNRKNDIKKDQYMKESQINLVRLKESDIRHSCDSLVRAALEQFPIIQGET
jgi:very-short-patch-repair endonuclease